MRTRQHLAIRIGGDFFVRNCNSDFSKTLKYLDIARVSAIKHTTQKAFQNSAGRIDAKPEISLGMKVDDERAFLAPFFERLAARRAAAGKEAL